MSLVEIQPYLSGVTAVLSVATLGFILTLLKQVRENAQDRLAVQEDRMKGVREDLERTEKWHKVEKDALSKQLDELTAQLNDMLKGEGITLQELSAGKQLSQTASSMRDATERLLKAIDEKLGAFRDLGPSLEKPNREWQLSAAMGAMASGRYSTAALRLDDYVEGEGIEAGRQSWDAHFARGVAHANSRGGRSSDFAALRAYNDAIAFAPVDLDQNRRSRLFSYRGAILKRLGRLDEAQADLGVALSFATDKAMRLDAHYNLAGVLALRGDRAGMLGELRQIRESKRYRTAVLAHLGDYFYRFDDDPELLALMSGRDVQNS